VVGDWVAIQAEAGFALIQGLVPRRTAFVRRQAGTAQGVQVAAANVDVALLALSLNADLNLRRLERYLAATYESGAAPVVVLTKADACADTAGAAARVAAVAGEAPVIAVSAVSGAGLAALADQLEPRRTAVLLGSSGVGKSTLVNALAGEALMATAAIREQDDKGRHTTTHRELIRLPSGALILDTPGMRELGLIDAEAGLATVFAGVEADVEALARGCRFADCAHDVEPGCAVRAALADGRLDPTRFESWRKLQRELVHERLKEDPLARKAQQREWISRMKSARAHMKDKRKIE
jgi:ribosome biogenesis GTPase